MEPGESKKVSDIIEESPSFFICEEFFVREELEELNLFIKTNAAEFKETRVIDSNGKDELDHHSRRSKALFNLGHIHGIMATKLSTYFPLIAAKLQMEAFPVSAFEVHLTATNQNQFFSIHSDNSEDAVASRTITFVLFTFKEPCPFLGGTLRIYYSILNAGIRHPSTRFVSITPKNNMIIFFPSHLLHEVLPVFVPSGDFSDSRFTLNGWIHKDGFKK